MTITRGVYCDSKAKAVIRLARLFLGRTAVLKFNLNKKPGIHTFSVSLYVGLQIPPGEFATSLMLSGPYEMQSRDSVP